MTMSVNPVGDLLINKINFCVLGTAHWHIHQKPSHLSKKSMGEKNLLPPALPAIPLGAFLGH